MLETNIVCEEATVPKIDGVIRELCEKAEFMAIVTNGDDAPHVVANWGDYLRKVGIEPDRIVLPTGGYRITEDNLQRDNRVQVLLASKAVHGTRTPGQGCLITGTGRIITSGDDYDRVKAQFPWARGVLIISVEDAVTQL